MNNNKKFNYYITFFSKKENLINKYVVDQSDYFFSRLEYTDDKKIEKFYLNVICVIMADCYDFFLEILKDTTYINRFKYINYTKGKQFYKISALYYTIKFIFFNKKNNANNIDYINYVKEEMFKIFNFSKKEKKIFNKFFYINSKNESEFEVEFIKSALRYMTGKEINSKIKSAIIVSFFNNSYEEFKKIYEIYLVREEFAIPYL